MILTGNESILLIGSRNLPAENDGFRPGVSVKGKDIYQNDVLEDA